MSTLHIPLNPHMISFIRSYFFFFFSSHVVFTFCFVRDHTSERGRTGNEATRCVHLVVSWSKYTVLIQCSIQS